MGSSPICSFYTMCLSRLLIVSHRHKVIKKILKSKALSAQTVHGLPSETGTWKNLTVYERTYFTYFFLCIKMQMWSGVQAWSRESCTKYKLCV